MRASSLAMLDGFKQKKDDDCLVIAPRPGYSEGAVIDACAASVLSAGGPAADYTYNAGALAGGGCP